MQPAHSGDGTTTPPAYTMRKQRIARGALNTTTTTITRITIMGASIIIITTTKATTSSACAWIVMRVMGRSVGTAQAAWTLQQS